MVVSPIETLDEGADETLSATERALKELEAERGDLSDDEYFKRRLEITDSTHDQLTEAVDRLDRLDWNLSLEELEQDDQALLQDLSSRIITKMRHAEYEISSIAELPKLKDSVITKANLGSLEVKAYRLFLENADSRLAKGLENFAADASLVQPIAESIVDPEKESKMDWVKDAAGGVWDYAKNNKLKAAGLVTIGALGLYGLYKLVPRFIKGFFADNKKSLGWTFGMATKGTAIATTGGALVAAGMLLGPESWRTWTRDRLGTNFSLKSVWESIKGLSLSPLFEGCIDISKADRAVAKTLKVGAEKVSLLRDVAFNEFDDVSKKWIDRLEGRSATLDPDLGIDVDLPFLQDSAERERAVEATEKLLKLFVSPEIKATLRGRDIKTVGDAIDIIAENL